MNNALGTTATAELGQDPILDLPLDHVRPSPENAELYRPVDPADPEIKALAESILKHGIQEPLLVTRDGWILSGHRRRAAAVLAGLETVPCRVKDIEKDVDHDQFMCLLRECNRQRAKSFDEKVREEIISVNPEEAYRSLIAHRKCRAAVAIAGLAVVGHKHRAEISAAKEPFLQAVRRVLEDRKNFWPLSDRQVHYALLNAPPLRHASKPDSAYDNTPVSYKSLVDLLTRARLSGNIPFEAIADPTRPVTVWRVQRDCQGFIRQELDGFLRGYWRDLLQSQPNHIEIIGEKNTVASILEPVAAQYCIPLTIGRGYCSLPPRYEMAKRFRAGGKEKLVLLMVTDFDPDGEEIAHSMARSLRDDFGIQNIVPVKVALTADQVKRFALPPGMDGKKSSVNYAKFTSRHGKHTHELEALRPEDLQRALREAIDRVIDVKTFNAELDQEKRDAAHLAALRRATCDSLMGQFAAGGFFADKDMEL